MRTDHAWLPIGDGREPPQPGRPDGSGSIADRLRKVALEVVHDGSARLAAEHAGRMLRKDRRAWESWVRYERAGPEEALFIQIITDRCMNAAEVARSLRNAANAATG
ncbi:MAG: hypothetical protein S0880_02440 [Actinomycetota bacterium]|nr:hypothetical protein [Actinomycetota bacterium]